MFGISVLFLISVVQAGAPEGMNDQSGTNNPRNIIVTPPPTEAERREQVRELARRMIRPPRRNRPIARFFYPICPQVLGLYSPDARAIEDRIRQNARELSVGASDDPACVVNVKIAFMSPGAGPPNSWLTIQSPQLGSLPRFQRMRVLDEQGPVRAWNRIAVRDYDGRPITLEEGWNEYRPFGNSSPIVTTEITGAAVLIERDVAQGMTLMQLADYATMRTLLGTSGVGKGEIFPANTILSLFTRSDAPEELTLFDKAMISELYNASRNSTPRRVYNDIASNVVQKEAALRGNGD